VSTQRTPYQEAARELLRHTVFDAARAQLGQQRWSEITMADIASSAGVSRQTLYNEFGSRPALVEAYITREIEVLVQQVSEAVRVNADDAHRALRDAFTLFLKLASDEPVVQLIVNGAEGGELHRLLTGLGQAVASEHFAVLIPQVWPQVGPADGRLLADTLVRLAISHALLPAQEPSLIARGVGRMLAPFVDELLAEDPPAR
jgi:AcrR family transcriptional regulator